MLVPGWYIYQAGQRLAEQEDYCLLLTTYQQSKQISTRINTPPLLQIEMSEDQKQNRMLSHVYLAQGLG